LVVDPGVTDVGVLAGDGVRLERRIGRVRVPGQEGSDPSGEGAVEDARGADADVLGVFDPTPVVRNQRLASGRRGDLDGAEGYRVGKVPHTREGDLVAVDGDLAAG